MENDTLVEKSRCGDRDAFAQIVQRYQGMVSAVTLNVVGNYAQSEDLAQETFLTAWKKLPELREPEKLASWLYGIARRVALRWTEQHQRNPLRQAVALDAETMTDYQAQIADADRQQREQSLELIWSTVKELPETLREPLLLYYRFSKSVADIADSLELTEEAVRQRLSRGRKMLKAEVEKHVKSVLEATGPSEHFTVAVLAALPVFATAPEVFAATSVAGSAGAAAKSSGGVPVLAGISVYLGWLANVVFIPLALLFGVVFGAWSGIRNSPTLRSRRFMLKAVIFQTLMGLSLCVFFGTFVKSCTLFEPMAADTPILMTQFTSIFCCCFAIFIGIYCIASSYFINQRWRKIVEEDRNQLTDLETLEQSSLSLWHLRKFLHRCMAMPFIAILPTIPFTMVLCELYGDHWWRYFEWTQFIFFLEKHTFRIALMALAVIPVLYIFTHVAKRTVIDEQSLIVFPPKNPNLLRVLTGEEKPKQGFRNRINIVSELLLVGIGFCMLQWTHPTVFILSFAAYLLFAMFFAGIPRKRYFGYIYFGTFCAALHVIALLIEPRLYSPWGGVVFGFILFWLFCFITSGVAGLWAFRKR